MSACGIGNVAGVIGLLAWLAREPHGGADRDDKEEGEQRRHRNRRERAERASKRRERPAAAQRDDAGRREETTGGEQREAGHVAAAEAVPARVENVHPAAQKGEGGEHGAQRGAGADGQKAVLGCRGHDQRQRLPVPDDDQMQRDDRLAGKDERELARPCHEAARAAYAYG